MRSWLRWSVITAAAALAVACGPPSPAPGSQTATPTTAAPPTAATPRFVNRVWRVAESSTVAPGQLYVFLSEGTLVVASGGGTPALGRWSRTAEGLTMVEEGLSYRTDIVSLTADEFRIRSHNPGQPVDIRLVPADRDPQGDGQ